VAPDVLVLVGVAGIGAFFLLAIFVLPQRKLPEEKDQKPLYEERCSVNWQFAGGVLSAGGNIPIARVSFYDGFFVVALLTLTKVHYSEVLSTSFKSGWLSRSITMHLAKGRSLVIHPKNIEKIRVLLEASGNSETAESISAGTLNDDA